VIKFNILGRIEIITCRQRYLLGSGKLSSLTVALLIQRGLRLGPERLFECLWHDPPASALANLRTYAYRLRNIVGTRCLSERAGGYLLEADPGDCDHAEFRRLSDLGRAAIRGRDFPTAAARFEQALRLWRHDSAAEAVPRHGPLTGWLGALDDERARVTEDLAEVRLKLRQESIAVEELRDLLAVAPTRSRAWRLRMMAHHALREPDAVHRSYQEAVETFRRHLDIEIDPELTALWSALVKRR
jgi:DNA-binding SARP family transcriptional activator